MKSSVTKAFRKKLNELSASVQEQATKAYELWCSDPYHNSLQFKRVSQRQPIYSARVSLDYRFLAYWKMTTSTGFGLAHTQNTMNCFSGCSDSGHYIDADDTTRLSVGIRVGLPPTTSPLGN